VILVVAESQPDGALHAGTVDAVTAARQLAHDGEPVVAVLAAGARGGAHDALARLAVDEVRALLHPALEAYTADAVVMALAALVGAAAPRAVVWAHTYQARDAVPALAARLGVPLVTDVIAVGGTRAAPTFFRPAYGGKLVAEVRALGGPPLLTCQLGAFRATAAVEGGRPPAPVVEEAATVDPARIRQRPEPPFREDRQVVDLGQARRIVAVGRGLGGAEHLPAVERLARVLDAELAASRPVCDSGWLPMARQVGSSGQTVAPALYLALGISGAIQHVVGMRGARTVVAINKDASAPIFDVADYAVVGDLFAIVPALVEALEQDAT
jgi:electron transfer flavoprotein alpha subunit